MKTYVIAEIGQNHNGSVDIARALIDMAADPRPAPVVAGEQREPLRASAVKFTKRKLNEEGSRGMMSARYGGPHSFGATYGEHRRALELEWDDLAELSRYAKSSGLDFGLTVCHPDCVQAALARIPHLSFLKVASRDLENIPLLRAINDADRPHGLEVIVSTGMSDQEAIVEAVDTLADVRRLALLHCRSAYPVAAQDWDLQIIPTLSSWFGSRGRIGYSDHSVGVLAPALAVALGAEVIEKHVTLDRRLKGSDQLGSVEREGLYRMLRSIQEAELAVSGPKLPYRSEAASAARAKLARSLHYASSLIAGTEVEERHLVLLSPGTGLPYADLARVVGRRLRRSVEAHELVALDDYD